MQQQLLKILGLVAGGLIINKILTEDEQNYNDMANTHNHFLKFEQNISLTTAKKEKLIASRKALQDRIINYFKLNSSLPVPKFYIQGSYKMKTMVLSKDGTYDVDLGIYFLTNPYVTSYTVQENVKRAVNGHTSGGAEHREKCIRVKYSGDFDIDLPIYYKTLYDKPYLATKTAWQQSDPKELCDWFEKQRKSKDVNGQMLRLIKYFKRWAAIRTRKMPSGIAFTVWVTENYKSNSRDDIAFYETAKAIKSKLSWGVSCRNPATPFDDFTSKLDNVQKRNFIDALDNLITEAEIALKQESHEKALAIWNKHLGNKFPTI